MRQVAKRTGKRGVSLPPEPPEPTGAELEEFLRGARSTEEQRSDRRKNRKKEPEKLPLPAGMKRLPGMEDPVLEDLEEAAIRYAQVRDERMALTKKEVDMQELLLNLMKRHKKTSYLRDGVELKVVAEKEKVRVRIKKEEE